MCVTPTLLGSKWEETKGVTTAEDDVENPTYQTAISKTFSSESAKIYRSETTSQGEEKLAENEFQNST